MSDIRRIIGDYPKDHQEKTVRDQWGIGCMQEYISFSFTDGPPYLFDREKKMAEMVLAKNKNLWRAIVFLPSGLSPDLIYAQCSFPIEPTDDHNYKEASGLNNFLKKDGVLPFMRKYNVSSLIVCNGNLADGLNQLDEPRIEESLFVIKDNTLRVERYNVLQTFSARGIVKAEQAKVAERLVVKSQSVRCPLCGWSPRKDDRWFCNCGHTWSTFDTRGVCPACAYRWTVTMCLSCERPSPHSDWYAGKVESGQPHGIRGFLKRLFG